MTLFPYGYTFGGKGTVTEAVDLLRHEPQVYAFLENLQGNQITVCFGGVDLKHALIMDSLVEIIEGFDEKDGEKYKAFCKAQHKLTKQLRQMGVVHGDLYQPNMLWNEEMQQFMAIDFEQGTLMPKKHPNKPYLYPKRMRNSSDPENAKRSGGLLAAQIKHTEGHCDSVHQRLSGALKPTDSFLAIQTGRFALCVKITILLLRGKMDLKQLLHIRNFWKRHLTSREEYTLHSSYKLTDPPLGWHVNFGRRLTFGSKWIGYYWARRPYRSSDVC
ncbi:conserved hypothetical protein [Coccidioides posadasii str. Silveira]|uniref:non-specific serine/threonine protein kinase n=1 Tax=Coccidioides posadasii (strain RMSCC 757 / Silveira) TaxID=443226 RepID=E9D0L7_COCPS|nr:conserved hypothetical protein [Coccidioides posadasii str. Silveira]